MMVLLKEACTWAMPSAIFFLTFLRMRTLALAMLHYSLLGRLDRLNWALASPGIGLGALTANGQTATMAHATVTAQIHQTLDVHGNFTAQIAFHLKPGDFIAQLLNFGIVQILDLGRG